RTAASDDTAAQNAEGQKIQEVVVTGTNIRGLTPESSPLTVYTAQDIKNQGATTIDTFVRKLPQNFSSLSAANANGAAAGIRSPPGDGMGGTSIDLRGLGAGTTLILLNGRRLAPSFSGTAVDVSLLPLNALDRVEVLTDGASAAYGSDAVGGVVNFILK